MKYITFGGEHEEAVNSNDDGISQFINVNGEL